MSNYTVLLCDLINSGFDIGLKDYPIFDETYRATLNKKIIDHYYTREIGAETPALFKLWLNRKMNEIMPYYNKVYQTELIEFDPLITNKVITKHLKDNQDSHNTDNTADHNKNNTSAYTTDSNGTYNRNRTNDLDSKEDMTANEQYTENRTTDHTEHITSNKETIYSEQVHNVFSDTPQNLVHDGYVADDYFGTTADYNYKETQTTEDFAQDTTAKETMQDTHTKDNTQNTAFAEDVTEVIADTSTSHTDEEGTAGETFNQTQNETHTGEAHEQFIEEITGLNTVSQSDLIDKYRNILLNIDMMIIEQLKYLFMMVY